MFQYQKEFNAFMASLCQGGVVSKKEWNENPFGEGAKAFDECCDGVDNNERMIKELFDDF